MTFRKALVRAAAICIGLPLLLPLLFGPLTMREYLMGFAIGLGLVNALSLFVGLIVSINPKSRVYGQAMMTTSAILLLVSFTLCSTR
jgi:hypothetical protein